MDETLISQCDYLFFPGGAQLSLFFKSQKPVIYYADASAHLMQDYYWMNMSESALSGAKSLENRSAKHASINIRSSKWAITSVVNDSHCSPSRCYVLELGPNIDMKDVTPNPPYEKGTLNILFSGVDWPRKGGVIAVRTVELLVKKGLDARLIVVGPKEMPSECRGHKFIKYAGFLNKNNPTDYQRYIALYKMSHLFLLPTTAECAGVVFSEASAFGIPSYTYDTGGTSSYVVDGINGHALPTTGKPEDFANLIYKEVKSGKLKEYWQSTLQLSRERLTWEAFSHRFAEIMQNTLI